MKAKLYIDQILFALFISIAATSYSQDFNKKNIGDVIYAEYKKADVGKALTKYRELKNKHSEDYVFNEDELNTMGYKLMREGDLEAAEKVFKMNIEEYPQAANPYDSYADYLLEKGDKEAARKQLEKAIFLAEKSENRYDKEIFYASKAKLAKLENKHKQLDFLLGKWKVTYHDYRGGGEVVSDKIIEEYQQTEDEHVIMVNVIHDSGIVLGKRIWVYDAIDEEYDLVYIDTEAPTGLYTSSLKLKDLGNNRFELTEKFQHHAEDADKIRHEIIKTQDDIIEWVVYQSESGKEDWKKGYTIAMNKIE